MADAPEDSAFTTDSIRPDAFNDGYLDRFFIPEGLLGRGGRGEVIKVRHILEGCDLGTFALKRCSVGDSHTWLTKMLREVQSLKFQHENLIRYNHVWLEHAQLSLHGPRVPVLHILQEHCNGGDLEAYVLRRCGKVEPTVEEIKARRRRQSRGAAAEEAEGMSMDTIYSIFKDLVAGLAVLHEQNVIHRDLKPSNCLLDFRDDARTSRPRAIVSDFGEAQFGLSSSVEARQGGTGTLLYTAPEIVRGEAWTQAADVFSLGMILHFMTHAGQLPYLSPDSDFPRLRSEIASFRGYAGEAQYGSTELTMLLSELLSPIPANRPTSKDLLSLLHSTQKPWSVNQNAFEPFAAGTNRRRLSTLVLSKESHGLSSTRETSLPPMKSEKLTLPAPKSSLSIVSHALRSASMAAIPISMLVEFTMLSKQCSPGAISTSGLFMLTLLTTVQLYGRQAFWARASTLVVVLSLIMPLLLLHRIPAQLLCV